MRNSILGAWSATTPLATARRAALLASLGLLAACGGGSTGGSSGGGDDTGGGDGADVAVLDGGPDGASDDGATTDADDGATSDADDGATSDADDGATSDAGDAGDGASDAPVDTAPKPCTSNGDCTGNPKGAVCDVATGACVGCLPSADTCPTGKRCDPSTNACVDGCKASADCAGDPAGKTVCSATTHACVICDGDGDCPLGKVCASNACVDGCNASHGCAGTSSCCSGACLDLQNDVANCGTCGTPCVAAPQTVVACSGGTCKKTGCAAGWFDCNGDPTDGCEQNLGAGGTCLCTPGATQPCYDGPSTTFNVGACHGGTQTCDGSGMWWGFCVGEVTPKAEICGNGIDEDCNGTADVVADVDGDGWGRCDGDCCEFGTQCSNPKLVNPGAYDVAGDGLDNDCNGVVDDTPTTVCSSAAKFAGVTGSDVAKAMDLCQTTTAAPPLAQKKWGLIAATQLLADGSAPNTTALSDLQNWQTSIKTNFGTGGVVPQKNSTLAVISTGRARAAADSGWVLPISGSTFTTAITFPGGGPLATYVNAHGGQLLAGKCGTTTCPVGAGANDSVNVRLQIRTPTNATGFSYNFRFYTGEYQSFQCTQFNDYFLASLTSGSPSIPADHNISFDSLKNAVSVNNGFFQDCGGNGKACGTCPFGTASLAGTGFDQVAGGSTEWLTTDAPIVPGEVITLEFVIFDVGDHIYDSTVLLDNFRWQFTPVTLGTH
jgi:hypothetical protein